MTSSTDESNDFPWNRALGIATGVAFVLLYLLIDYSYIDRWLTADAIPNQFYTILAVLGFVGTATALLVRRGLRFSSSDSELEVPIAFAGTVSFLLAGLFTMFFVLLGAGIAGGLFAVVIVAVATLLLTISLTAYVLKREELGTSLLRGVPALAAVLLAGLVFRSFLGPTYSFPDPHLWNQAFLALGFLFMFGIIVFLFVFVPMLMGSLAGYAFAVGATVAYSHCTKRCTFARCPLLSRV